MPTSKVKSKQNASSNSSAKLKAQVKSKSNGKSKTRARSKPDVVLEVNADTDPFAILESSTESEGQGEACVLHTYDSRTDSRGESLLLRTGSKSEIQPEKERSHEAALILTRRFTASQKLQGTELEVKSRHIKAALRKVVRSYPGININGDGRVIIFNEPQCLFHYREELQAYAEASQNPQVKSHITFCLQYMARALRREIVAYDHFMKNETHAPGLEHENLWMAFKPGALIFREVPREQSIALERLRAVSRVKGDNYPDYWRLDVERIECDGQNFRHAEFPLFISHYDGYKPFTELRCFPLQYHSEQERIKQELGIRGRKYVSLFGVHYCLYEGVAQFERPPSLPGDNSYSNSKRQSLEVSLTSRTREEQCILKQLGATQDHD